MHEAKTQFEIINSALNYLSVDELELFERNAIIEKLLTISKNDLKPVRELFEYIDKEIYSITEKMAVKRLKHNVSIFPVKVKGGYNYWRAEKKKANQRLFTATHSTREAVEQAAMRWSLRNGYATFDEVES